MARKKKEEIYFINCPHCGFNGQFVKWDDVQKHIKQEHATIFERIERGDFENKIPYSRENRDAYREEEYRLTRAFRSCLELEYEVSNNPKAQKLWDLAWGHGHSSGYSEVANYYSDFVDLVL